jgi:hypothetical protein
MRSHLLLLTLAATTFTAAAQSPTPLPANYKTVLENSDVLVQRVHYGPHEFVPPHDHYAVVTVLVYLNDSGVVELAHDPKPGDTEPDVVKRPPTHTGAFRIGPAAFERHSVRNLGDVPSDFFRVELKKYPPDALKDQVRGPAPTPPLHDGVTTEYKDAHLRIDRIVCKAATLCNVDADPAPSVLITIPTPEELNKDPRLAQWIPAAAHLVITTSNDHAQYLRILLLQP